LKEMAKKIVWLSLKNLILRTNKPIC